MRIHRLAIFGMAAILLASAPGLTQFPGGGGGWQGKGGGGGGRRGGGGGGRMGGGDPNATFDMFARGKDVLIKSEMDPSMQPMFDRFATAMGITNGQITRQQFVTYMQQRQAERAGGGNPGGGPPGAGGGAAAPGAPENRDGNGDNRGGRGGWNPDTMADRFFQRLDQNGDGLLNYDEMPDALRQERDKWDTNKDGFIDATEFRAFFQARMQQTMADRGGAGGQGAWDGSGAAPETEPIEEVRKPVVHRVGALPKELPPWFAQLDKDKDAQIGLYEWKESGRPIEEFMAIDRNKDGFLTVDEVLYYVAQNKERNGETVSSPGENRGPGPNNGGGGNVNGAGDRPGVIGPRIGIGGGGRGRFGPDGQQGGRQGRGGRGNGGDAGGGPGAGRVRGPRNTERN